MPDAQSAIASLSAAIDCASAWADVQMAACALKGGPGSGRYPKGSGGEEKRGALNNLESEIANQSYETGAVFSADGELILRKDGDGHSIKYTADETTKMSGAILTHNHPGGGSFSQDDVIMMYSHDAVEMRAVTDKYVFVIRNSKPSMTSDEYGEHFRSTLTTLKSTYSGDRSSVEFNHVFWGQFSQSAGLAYERRDR